jgi:hypothetical protein
MEMVGNPAGGCAAYIASMVWHLLLWKKNA